MECSAKTQKGVKQVFDEAIRAKLGQGGAGSQPEATHTHTHPCSAARPWVPWMPASAPAGSACLLRLCPCPALCRSLHPLVPLLVFESNSYRCGRGFWVQRRPMLHAHVTNEAPVHSQPWTTMSAPAALCRSASELIRWQRLVSQMAAMAAAVGAAAAAAHSCESIVYVLITPKHHTAHGSLSRSKHAEALL